MAGGVGGPAGRKEAFGLTPTGRPPALAPPRLPADLAHHSGRPALFGFDQPDVGIGDDSRPGVSSVLEIGGQRGAFRPDPTSHGAVAALALGTAGCVAGHLVDMPAQTTEPLLHQPVPFGG